MIEAQMSRRDVLKFSALGAAVVALPLERVVRAKTVSQIAASKLPAPYTLPFAVPPVVDGRSGGTVTLDQKLAKAGIIPGFQTTIFGYALPGQAPTTPGPTIHAKRGTPLTVMQANRLPAAHPFLNYDPWTSTHLHGSASKPQYDGYASDITKVGQTKRYVYPNKQDARTLWYHDHGVHHTAENAYMGLAAQYHLHDDVESGLAIPKWSWDGRPVTDQYDLPLVLADKMFSANGEFRYDDAGHTGLWGDVVLVNGVPWPNLKVKKRLYRFRVLNASISRGYRLQMSNSTPMSVIGTDGGLMPQVQQTTQLRIGMAERYEIVIDFSKYTPGTKLQLLNLGVPNSTDFDNTGKIMQFEVVNDAFDPKDNALPTGGLYSLNPNKEVWDLKETEIQGTTKIEVLRQNGEWKIQSTSTSTASNSGSGGSGSSGSGKGGSGKGGSGSGSSGSGSSGSGNGTTKLMTWEDIIASNYKETVANPASGDVQIWEITNKSGGWFHPVHIHLVDFKMLTRNGKPVFNYEQGPKDVAFVGENETIRAIMKFGTAGDPTTDGRYMIHCHNLPHEDHDMMTQFRVGNDVDRDPDATKGPDDPANANCNDPINADPAGTTKD
ncbi:multicopper oxidase domain-containing protein [Pseudonocardia charpentierae]|uniref:Multicopper oxidase domain-containing protein n=1 Tax=Pseudonocardia charpentierae TaxID=3075545 RepID=A0ABU2N8H6_9PSEU|nr:multicopper oxidase domain-containing protein [Pseudonocardia sp. DSM 45834]MDT0350065.1 multicopper oxidase domain-containing protein [Pseudonocardia sp. DSM 45834]